MFTLLTDFKIAEIKIKIIRCNDSGENKMFYNVCGVILTSNSRVQELHNETERGKGSFRHSTGEFGNAQQCRA
jgi:hypothetical protein